MLTEPAVHGPLDFSVLTDREREVLRLLSSGETNRRLARHLGIAERTVRAHTASIVRKLSLRSKFEAALVSHLHAEQLAAGPHFPARAAG
ncbi:LuxR C-terminal-related transcriptional regulator [Streptomyces sp. LE64]|jgi:DNA-binding NarL/FixJ family response regulator|uniref:helix-turn-helix transcriptional regulator n=1 Tax=unclassified Streptomyces TaxID=2593676 RepID=UPI003323CC31